MKICFSTLGCPEWSWPEILSVAKDLGYDAIEVRGVKKELFAPRIRELQGGNAITTRKTLEEKGLYIACLTSACYLHREDAKEQTIKDAFAYIDTAAALGTPYIRVLGDTQPQPGEHVDEGLVKESLRTIAEYGREKGVMPLIETNGYFSDTRRLRALLTGIDNAGAVWDIHHPCRYFGETPEDTLHNIGPWVRHVHVKDSIKADGRIRYAMVGHGDLPVKKCIQLLIKSGFSGCFSLEWVKRWDLSLEEPGIAFARFAAYMNDPK